MRRRTIPGQLLRLLHLLVLGVLYLFIKLASKAPSIVDAVYSSNFYPVIRNAVSSVTRHIPFSLCEIIAIILAAVVAVILIIRIVKLVFLKKEALVRLVSLLITIILVCAYLVVAFYVMWGFNLYRLPVDKKLDLPEKQATAVELEKLCIELAEKAIELSPDVERDENGVFIGDFTAMTKSVQNAYALFSMGRPSFIADVPPAKPVIFSEVLSACGISGVFVFLTEEPNVNIDEPFLYTPFNAAHETAHYLGYAREEDANFIAFLVCMGSPNPSVRYSGYMHALVHCSKSLSAYDKEAYTRLKGSYTEGMKKDLAAYSAYYLKYTDTKVYNTANQINDSYLKINGQEKGTLSYSEDVALIIRYYESIGFFRQEG